LVLRRRGGAGDEGKAFAPPDEPMNDGSDLERRGPNKQRGFYEAIRRSPRGETDNARLDGTRGLQQFLGILFRATQFGEQPVII
jgi:hypothetical protein